MKSTKLLPLLKFFFSFWENWENSKIFFHFLNCNWKLAAFQKIDVRRITKFKAKKDEFKGDKCKKLALKMQKKIILGIKKLCVQIWMPCHISETFLHLLDWGCKIVDLTCFRHINKNKRERKENTAPGSGTGRFFKITFRTNVSLI